MNVLEVIDKFDAYLKKRKLKFEAVIIGGAALNIMKTISRDTIDVDCLDPKIPEAIILAAEDFRVEFADLKLHEKWLNNGPESLIRDLSRNWKSRLQKIYEGQS